MEYVRLEPGEKQNATKSLLENQMSLLNLIKIQRRYRNLRKQELTLKTALKRNLKEIHIEIKSLIASMPSSHYRVENSKETKFESDYSATRTDLEREIADIQKKLEELR